MGVLNIPAILALVEAAEVDAIEAVADFVAADAKSRAPIRKVFREAAGFRRKFRALTGPERSLAVKRAMQFSGYTDFQRRRSVSYLKNYARAELRRPGSANSLARSRKLRNLGPVSGAQARAQQLRPLLTSRGKYEVSSGRALHQVVSKGGYVSVHVGGRLKASIGNEGAVAKVAARVWYAKFVEFPTTHNASQPFLLPALQDARGRLRQTLARELRSKLGG
jgi:HK97 gp10 family phage protein